jgi:hypothetical protein
MKGAERALGLAINRYGVGVRKLMWTASIIMACKTTFILAGWSGMNHVAGGMMLAFPVFS